MKSNKEELPLVTVFSLIYNTGPFVIQALESVRAQTYPADKIQYIIIDDCSKDDSADVVEDWIKREKFPAKVIRHTKNQGLTRTLNEVLSLTKGKYWAGCCDDLWHPDFLMKQVELIEKCGDNVSLVYCDTSEIDENGKVITESYLKARGYNPENMPEGKVYKKLLLENFIPAVTVLMSVDAVRTAGGYDEGLKTEDIYMWLKLSKSHEIAYNSDNLVKYRRHPQAYSVSKKNAVSANRLLTYESHWGESKETDKIIIERLKKNALVCYLFEDKQLGEKWLKRLKEYELSFGQKTVYFLIERKISPSYIFAMYRLFAKFNLF